METNGHLLSSTKINNVLKVFYVKPLWYQPPEKLAEILPSALQPCHSISGSSPSRPHIQSSITILSGCCTLPFQSRSQVRRRCGALAGFPSRSLVLEDDAEQLSTQPVGQPRVFDDGHLEALAVQHGIVVGVDGSAHPLDDHQVGLTLPYHHRQHFVQAATMKSSVGWVRKIRDTEIMLTSMLLKVWTNSEVFSVFILHKPGKDNFTFESNYVFRLSFFRKVYWTLKVQNKT